MTAPTTVDPGLTPQAVQNFHIAAWIMLVAAVVLFRLFVWPWIRLILRILFPRFVRRGIRYGLAGLVAPLRLTPSYDDHIHSAKWRAFCDRYWEGNGRWCHRAGCGSRVGLQVHHLMPWKHFGHERKREVIGLCKACHDDVHRLFDVHDPGTLPGQIRFLHTPPRQLTTQRRAS